MLWLLPKVEGFSRSYRFSVGDRLVAVSLDLLVLLVEAAYTTDKSALLERANRQTNVVRYLSRLSKDLRLLSMDSYTFSAAKLEEISRMVAGWKRWQGARQHPMTRVGGLWQRIVSFENLFAAAGAAARGKHRRPDVARFLMNHEPELVGLREELIDGRYTPGRYRTFRVHDPKECLISAAPFRDRVAHHVLTRVLEPVFEPRFSRHSYASRKGYGTHLALKEARQMALLRGFALKCDIRKFFASIDHAILNAELARAVKCRQTLALAAHIIEASNAQENTAVYFPGDTLFTPYERRRGLPLGNQTSQFFANVYLNPLDQFVERVLRPVRYLRYIDDYLLFGDDRIALLAMRAAVDEFLCGLRLRTHPGKTRVYRCAEAVTFLGFRIFPNRVRLVRPNVVRFRRRLRDMERDYGRGELGDRNVRARIQAWIAHARHGDTRRLREQIFERAAFRRARESAAV